MNEPMPRNYKTDNRPQRGWWAPGKYLNRCHICGEGFIGDKRAGNCADCEYGPRPIIILSDVERSRSTGVEEGK